MPQKPTLYHLRVTLDLPVKRGHRRPYRDLAIKSNQSLSTLAKAITGAFDFDFDHCYGFYDNPGQIYKSSQIFELFTDLGEDPTPGAQGVEHQPVCALFQKDSHHEWLFHFDYGDNWDFFIKLIKTEPINPKTKYPLVTNKKGLAPHQYPDFDEEFDDDEDFIMEEADPASLDWLSDDCPLCRMLKDEGIDMDWYPDEPEALNEKPKRTKN